MDRNSRAVLKRLNRSKFPWNVDRGVGSGNRVLVGGQDTHGKGHFWGTLMLGHAQTCPRSISSSHSLGVSSDAASGYQFTVASCLYTPQFGFILMGHAVVYA